MKQSGTKIQNANLGTFLDSATNALDKGQQQFFTPRTLAEALFTPLARAHTCILDPNHGSAALLNASGMAHRYGLDIDHRSIKQPKQDNPDVTWNLTQADFTRWFPIAKEINFQADLIALNPPFSLRWHADRLAALEDSDKPNVRHAFKEWRSSNRTIDSTAASLLCAIDMLSASGEGFMICNADTASRLLGHPGEDAKSSARNNVWCWLQIPGLTFENQHTQFDVAVLYFSASHGQRNDDAPLFLAAPSGEADTVRQTLLTAKTSRPYAYKGRSLDSEYLSNQHSMDEAWHAIREEYAKRHLDKQREHHIWISEESGRIRTQLDTFSQLKLDASIVEELQELRGKRPSQLVVQQAGRIALQSAINSGIWSVDPKLIEAVESAIREYNAVRAPFYTPNPTLSLGWIDEVDSLPATTSKLEGIQQGKRYPIKTFTEQISYPGSKTNLAGEKESLTLSATELVVQVTGDGGAIHQFHVRRTETDPERTGMRKEVRHHALPALLANFDIPVPKDITQLHPERYQRNKQVLAALEARINRQLQSA
jgi:hypothetical protein